MYFDWIYLNAHPNFLLIEALKATYKQLKQNFVHPGVQEDRQIKEK